MLAALNVLGCRNKGNKSNVAAASASASAASLPYGPTSLPFNVPALDEFEPNKSVPSAAELARFPIMDLDRPANLTLPIDWRQDPYNSRAWAMRLNAWQFLPPMLLGYQASRDRALLRVAVNIALDGARSYPSENKHTNAFAWYDMAVASRASMLGYLLREGGHSGLLNPTEREVMVTAAIAHGEWLASPSHYRRRHNHGLYSDTGLLMMCAQLDRLKECDEWRKVARQRFSENLGETVSASGVHLEHSTSYHFTIVRLLEDRLRADDDEAVRGTWKLMREAAPWFVQPDGKLPQLGDTHSAPAPVWAAEAAAKLNGARFFEDAGYYSVKTPGAQLLVTGTHNSDVHKHQDDLSFVLSESNRRVFVDTGFLSYNDTPERSYLASAQGHNVFLADDRYLERRKLPQFSLHAAGEADGWFGVAGDNSHIKSGLEHERIWLYRPGNLLLIIDRFKGDKQPHQLSRYFHLAPEYATTKSPHGVEFKSAELAGELFDASAGATDVRVTKGVRKEPFSGIVAENEDQLLDAPVIEFVTKVPRRADVALLSVVELGKDRARGTYHLVSEKDGKLAIELDGQRLTATRAGSQLQLHAEPLTPNDPKARVR